MKKIFKSIEFYQKFYDNEHERRTEIDEAVGFPTTLLTLLIGGALFLFEKKGFTSLTEGNKCLNIGTIILTVAFVLTVIVTIGLLMRMFINVFKKYHYLPSPAALKNRELELNEHYLNYYQTKKTKKPSKKATKQTKKQFHKDLLNYYIEYATQNQLINDSRIKDFYTSRKFLIFSIILLGIIGVLLIIK